MHDARVVERAAVGGGLVAVSLAAEDALAASHRLHGQYVEVAAGGAKAYFALASDPGSRRWELLVRPVGVTASALATAEVGATVGAAEAAGKGFPYDEARGRPLLLAASGSGIAALTSTARARVRDGEAARTFLVFGVEDARSIALEPALRRLRDDGVHVVIAHAQGPIGGPDHAVGFVQNVVVDRALQLSEGMVFAAGHPAMIAALRGTAPEVGVATRDVRVNWGES